MPAVKPQSRTSLSGPTIQPGPAQPSGWRTENRWAGSRRSSQGLAEDGVHLPGVDHLHRGRLVPVGEHRGHCEVARRQPQTRQLGEDLDAAGVQPGLLLRLAQGPLDRGLVAVQRAAREGHLPRLRPHRVGPFGQQQVGAGRAVTEEHQHRTLARSGVLGGHEPGEVLGPDLREAVAQREQPVGQTLVPACTCCRRRRHPAGPVRGGWRRRTRAEPTQRTGRRRCVHARARPAPRRSRRHG